MIMHSTLISEFLLSAALMGLVAADKPHIMLHPWSLPEGSPEAIRGAGGVMLKLQDPEMAMYLWLYEWNLFDAIQSGQHTHGTLLRRQSFSADRKSALIESRNLSFALRIVKHGADITLKITNNTDHDWPEIAGIVPCFNPGPIALREQRFIDEEHTRTFFLGSGGFELLQDRAIHFNKKLRRRIDMATASGEFVFSSKWPTSPVDATAGILIRESYDKRWVTAIAWEDFISVQGHNPWKCMHTCVRVGPLQRGSSKVIRGKVYLIPGNKEDCLRVYQSEF